MLPLYPDRLKLSNRTAHLPRDPRHEQIDDQPLIFLGQRDPLGDAVPFVQTAAAAARTGMLGSEHRMSAHRRLFSVIGDDRGRKTPADKVLRMPPDGVHPLFADIAAVLFGQMESGAELRPPELFQSLINRLHDSASRVRSVPVRTGRVRTKRL